MPGSSETLGEMLCTALGNLIQQGKATKITDDLYAGSNMVEDLFANWAEVFGIMQKNNLKLKADKTRIAPTSATILDWNWNNGSISAGAHKISPLATCSPPVTVTSLRLFIDAYKVSNHVLRRYAQYVQDLEAAVVSKQKRDKIIWIDPLLESFKNAQSALNSTATITLPCPDDQLIIVHDGAHPGIGSVMYLVRNNVIHLGGFFSAKLKAHHTKWYPR